jgi:hypothetical protein
MKPNLNENKPKEIAITRTVPKPINVFIPNVPIAEPPPENIIETKTLCQ